MLEADSPAVRGEVFNVSDLLLDVRQILSLVQALTGCAHPLPETVSADGYLVMATEELRQLGWRPGAVSTQAA